MAPPAGSCPRQRGALSRAITQTGERLLRGPHEAAEPGMTGIDEPPAEACCDQSRNGHSRRPLRRTQPTTLQSRDEIRKSSNP